MFKILGFLKPYSFLIFISFLCSFLNVLINLSIPYIMQKLMDSAINVNLMIFKKYLYASALLIAFEVIITYFKKHSTNSYNFSFMKDMRNSLAKQIQSLPIYKLKKYTSGDLISRMNNDLTIISNYLSSIPEAFFQPLLFITALIYMLYISWKLTLATILLIPISSILYDKINKPIQSHSKDLMEQYSKLNFMLQDIIGGINILKAFNLKDTLASKFNIVTESIKTKGLKINKLNSYLTPIFLALRLIPQLVYPLYGGYLALNKEISLGNLFAYGMLISFVFGPVESILNIKGQVRETKPAVNRIFEILKETGENNTGTAVMKKDSLYPIEFNNISFSYDDNVTVLNNISLKIPKGTTTAIVGPSGSGKSSILKLLCRFYNPSSGVINIFGNNLNDYSYEKSRDLISYMSQESYLYPLTIAENIAIGKTNASMDEIINAAMLANAHDFIMELPKGYDTLLSERGANLSGGQCQRLSLARIILKNAPIILLDEPTASLDTQSEALIQASLDKFTKGKTVLIVAHRLSTIINADKIIVVSNGNIAEIGTHKELLLREGIYKKLYVSQEVEAC